MSVKKYLVVSLSVMMLLSQGGCGGGGSSPTSGGSAVSGTSSTSTGSTSSTTSATGDTATGTGANTTGTPATGGPTTPGTPVGTTTGSVPTGGPVSAATAQLSWDASQTGATGFKVYYGTSPGNYSASVNVGMVSSYTLSGLPAGTYYIAVSAYDAAGNESVYSNEVTKTLG
jgi:hypothetical protein